MRRAEGVVKDDVLRIDGRDVARVSPTHALHALHVTGSLPIVVRATVGRGDRPSWLPGAAAEFEAQAVRLAGEAAERSVEVWWRPTREDVLSDVPSTLSFYRKHAGFGLVLDPGAMMTLEMMPRVEEHAERILEALGGHAALRFVVGRPGPLADVLERQIDRFVAPQTPIVWVGDSEGVGLH